MTENTHEHIRRIFEESIETKKRVIESRCIQDIADIADGCIQALKNGKKIMFCGNGGSAADSQHLAAELSVRLRSSVNREGLAALNLATDSSAITACANDFDFDYVYARMVEALGNEGDVLVGITTSGKSPNVVKALKLAKKKNIKAYGFLGKDGKPAIDFCDAAFVVPCEETGRIQESHITAGHILIELIEDKLLEDGFIKIID